MSTIMQKIKEIEDEKLSWAQKGEVFQTPKSKSFEIQATCGTQTTKSFNEDNKVSYTLDEVNEKTKAFRESAMKPPPPAPLDSSSAIDKYQAMLYSAAIKVMATVEKPIDSSHGDSATSSNQVTLESIERSWNPFMVILPLLVL
ncbi:hypothetical protein Rs2_18690 [Raphanus sativus]|nr:hypothetical protein Rs2_18690 [Raphanus sativus]